MPSATSTGHTMSQSILGCIRLTSARARALSIAFIWTARGGEKSAPNSLPHFRQALHRDRHGGLQLLREKLNAQLLEQPAELLELRVAVARLELPRLLSLPQGSERRKLRGEARIAMRVRAQLVQPQARRLEIAREMLQALVKSLFDEPPRHQPGGAFLDVAAGLRKRLGGLLQLFLERGTLGENCSGEPRDFLREQRDARARFVAAPLELDARTRPGLLHAGTIESRSEQLLLQLRDLAERGELKRHPLRPGQILLDVASLLLQLQSE